MIEQNIGLSAHVRRVMPRFLSLRDADGNGLATAMVPRRPSIRPIVVGPLNSDPYPEHGEAMRTLGERLGIPLERARCYPYSKR